MNTDMDLDDPLALEQLLDAPPTETTGVDDNASMTPAPTRLAPFLHRIPVTLTLEAGSARLTLQELAELTPDSVVPLNTMVGEPLTIKVNGSVIGTGEVVISGESYGLKVLELTRNLPDLGR